MDRRALLRAIGAAGTVGALAGCLGSATAPGDSSGTAADEVTADETETSEPETETGTDAGETSEPETETSTPGGNVATVGDASAVAFPETNRPHLVAVENVAGSRTTLGVSVSAEGRGEVWTRTVDLDPGETFDLRLVAPAEYTLTLRRTRGGSTQTSSLGVPLSYFDCNDSTTTVEVTANGLRTQTASTEVGCPAPELVDTAFDAGEGECGDEGADAADVRYDGETVRVAGAVTMPDPCRDVSLAEADYDGAESTLFLTVEVAAADPAATCIACLGVRDYEITADFDVDLPDRVVVRHAGADRPTEVVERAVRGGEAE